MKISSIFVVTLCVIVSTSVLARPGFRLADRVDALEDLSLIQQDQIDQNTADIQALQGGGSSGSGWVVLDANSQQVGDVLAADTNYFKVILVRGEKRFVVQVIAPSPVRPLGGIYGYATLFYKNNSCTGQAYTYSQFFLEDTFFNAVPIVLNLPNVPQYEKAVILEPDGPSENFEALGYVSNQGCQPVSQTSDYTPVTLGEDLHLTYPRPYSLILQ